MRAHAQLLLRVLAFEQDLLRLDGFEQRGLLRADRANCRGNYTREQKQGRSCAKFRGAHASRVLVPASRRHGLLARRSFYANRKACFGETPKPTRETRALPRFA